jgi:hypothetical protein
MPFGESPLPQQGELDLSPANERWLSEGAFSPGLLVPSSIDRTIKLKNP